MDAPSASARYGLFTIRLMSFADDEYTKVGMRRGGTLLTSIDPTWGADSTVYNASVVQDGQHNSGDVG